MDDWVTSIVVYILLWWWIFFMTLPFGVRREENPEEGHDTGAPKNPMLWRKAAVTTVVAAVLWFGVDYIIASEIISFRDMANQ